MTTRLIVLDVDRTLIAGTAWPRFLRGDHSPLDDGGRAIFEKLDHRRYGSIAPTLSEIEYRDSVLALLGLERTASPDLTMFAWGRSTASRMHMFSRPAEIVRSLCQLVPEAEIVYLTSGWTPFMAGVVDEVRLRTGTSATRYSVVGSTMENRGGVWRTSSLLDGAAKAGWLHEKLNNGFHIELLADDQHHDTLPFDRVTAAGGRSFKIDYRGEGHDPWEQVKHE